MIRVGLSGWTYKGWRGSFYPKGLPARAELAYASRRFGSIEVNGTFYRLQRPESFARWAAETPDDFLFAIKGSRFITHMLKLTGVERALERFFASGLERLGHKLGPILWQLPARQAFDEARLDSFLAQLPRRHRHALEPRHDSFRSPAALALLERHRVALVQSESPAWPLLEAATADFTYIRLHGAEELYASGYDAGAIEAWARRIEAAARAGLDVYCYFDNDAKVRAPVDALALMRRLGLQPCRDSLQPDASCGAP